MTIAKKIFGMGRRVAATASSGDWWDIAGETCVGAYAAKGAASLAASYTNLANPGTNDAAPGVAPTWDVTNGWIFNGSTQYLKTEIDLDNTSATMIYRFTNLSAQGDKCPAGRVHFRVFPYYWGDTRQYRLQTSKNAISGAVTSGVIAITSSEGYYNGSSDGALNAPDGNYTGTGIYIGARNSNALGGDTIADYAPVYIQAIAFYSTILDSTQLGSLTTAMNAL